MINLLFSSTDSHLRSDLISDFGKENIKFMLQTTKVSAVTNVDTNFLYWIIDLKEVFFKISGLAICSFTVISIPDFGFYAIQIQCHKPQKCLFFNGKCQYLVVD